MVDVRPREHDTVRLRGVDYSFSRPDPDELARLGYSFVVRYASRVDGGKNLTPAEARSLTRSGLKIITAWENVAADRDPLRGRAQGAQDARDHAALVSACEGPDDAVLYFAVDWNATPAEFPALREYFAGCCDELSAVAARPQELVGCYGHTRLLTYLLDEGVIGHGWVAAASAWSVDHTEPRARLHQLTPTDVQLAGGVVDVDESTEDVGWRCLVTFAPLDLQAVQHYAQAKTGQTWDALGITHSTPQGGGYHEGQDLLEAANTCPGSVCSGTDYSYEDARSVSSDGLGRDLSNASTLAGEPDAASAFDFGSGFRGGYAQFLEYNRFVRDLMLTGDSRTRDIRELIYTPDGKTVRRVDRTGRQPDSGDGTHLTHTHHSFFRDSYGRRDRDDNFMGVLKEFFGDVPPGSAGTEGDDDMFALSLEVPHRVPVYGPDPADPTGPPVIVGYRWPDRWPDGYATYTIPTVGDGTIPWGRGWVSLCNDTFGPQHYAVRVAGGNGGARVYNDGAPAHALGNLQRWYAELDQKTAFISLKRQPVDTNDPMTAFITACVEVDRRTTV